MIDYNFLITGVFHNLLPGLPNTVQSQTFRGVLSFLSSVLDIDVLALVSTTKPVQRHQGTATSRDTEPSDSASVSIRTYSQKILLDKNLAQSFALQCGKNHHRLYVIIIMGQRFAG